MANEAGEKTPEQLIAEIDQKALGLSGLLRDIDNHPVELSERGRAELSGILEMLSFRCSATRTLINRQGAPTG